MKLDDLNKQEPLNEVSKETGEFLGMIIGGFTGNVVGIITAVILTVAVAPVTLGGILAITNVTAIIGMIYGFKKGWEIASGNHKDIKKHVSNIERFRDKLSNNIKKLDEKIKNETDTEKKKLLKKQKKLVASDFKNKIKMEVKSIDEITKNVERDKDNKEISTIKSILKKHTF